MMEKVERWEKEKKGGERGGEGGGERGGEGGRGGDKEVTGNEEEWRLRVRRIEVLPDKKERERKICNVVVKGMGEKEVTMKAEVARVWGRMGLGLEGIKEEVKIGRVGKKEGEW